MRREVQKYRAIGAFHTFKHKQRFSGFPKIIVMDTVVSCSKRQMITGTRVEFDTANICLQTVSNNKLCVIVSKSPKALIITSSLLTTASILSTERGLRDDQIFTLESSDPDARRCGFILLKSTHQHRFSCS